MSRGASTFDLSKRLLALGGGRIFSLVGAAFAGSLVEGLTLSLFVPVLFGNKDEIIAKGGKLFRYLDEAGLLSTIQTTLMTLVAAVCLRAIVEYFRQYFQTQVGFDVGEKIRLRALSGLGNANYRTFLGFNGGELTSFFNHEIAQAINAFSKLAQCLALLFASLAMIMASALINFRFTLIAVGVGGLLGAIYRYSNRWLVRTSRENSKLSSEYHSLFSQILVYFKYLSSTERFGVVEEKVVRSLNKLLTNKRGFSRRAAVLSATQEPIAVIVIVLLVLYETVYLDSSMSSLMVSLLIFYRVLKTLNSLQLTWQGYVATLGSVEVVTDTLDRLDTNPAVESFPATAPAFADRIDVKSVSVQFGDRKILDNVDVTIRKNEWIAFVGESGAGKTTLVDVLTGLVRPDAGVVTVDGADLHRTDPKAWRKSLGLVMQEPIGFYGTVFENISFWATPDAGVRRKAEEVARLAGVDSFIQGRSEGMDSLMGDRGVKFSGGQRQRIAIARELYRDPNLLLLDEATSALDAQSEKLVLESFTALKGKMTMVMVTHRLAMVRPADRIYVLDQGKVVESGSFRELFGREKGRFRTMCELQGLTND